MIHTGTSELTLSAVVEVNGTDMPLQRFYQKPKPGKKTVSTYDRGMYAAFTDRYLKTYLDNDEAENLPVFVSYGTNRSVLDIPLRIRNQHDFSQISALEYSAENELGFRTFFEWFRNQEDLENQIAKEQGDFFYQDGQLKCVRKAVEAMLGNVSGLKVKRNPLAMVVEKNGREIRVDLLSDGEKCTLALFGDLARRLAIANPQRSDPLEGEGIVLIDEIELHMHPSWQRKVLRILKEVFPNLQFIVTTHSPQILGETDDSYNVFLISEDEKDGCMITKTKRLDGHDSNMILEEYMGTSSQSMLKKNLVTEINRLIALKNYGEAEIRLRFLKEISGDMDEEYIMADGFLKRSRILNEKN